MRKITLFSIAVSFLSAQVFGNQVDADQAPTRDALAADEAYVLVDMGARGALRQYVSSLNFSADGIDYNLSIPKEKGVQLVKVKAGTYQPDTLGLTHAHAKMKTRQFDDGGEAIVIQPGTVTYIGNWDILYGNKFTFLGESFTNKKTAYRVSYSVNSVKKYAKENQWIRQFPLRFSHVSGHNVVATWTELNGL